MSRSFIKAACTAVVLSIILLVPVSYAFAEVYDFESNQDWDMWNECEEIRDRGGCHGHVVNGIVVEDSACYGGEIGGVAQGPAKVRDVAYFGASSLRVWANQAGGKKHNHVIAQKRLTTNGTWMPGVSGIWSYTVHAYIDMDDQDPMNKAKLETGPEFSMQNTREIEKGTFHTTTAGFQYVANPFKAVLVEWSKMTQAEKDKMWSQMSQLDRDWWATQPASEWDKLKIWRRLNDWRVWVEWSQLSAKEQGETWNRLGPEEQLRRVGLPPEEKYRGLAGWHTFHTQTLATHKWYRLTLVANFDTNSYVRFTIDGPGVAQDIGPGVTQDIDLSGYAIANEAKWKEAGFLITLEGENMWSGDAKYL